MSSHVKELLLLSSSECHGYGYLEFALPQFKALISKHYISEILLIPYASKNLAFPTNNVRSVFQQIGVKVEPIQCISDPEEQVEAINRSQAIYISGGNTFRLLKALYARNFIEAIRKRVLEDGVPYIGISAGSNVASTNICTTNDMPIEYPPSLEALDLVPFNINPHYDPDNTYPNFMETRDERIQEYHEYPWSHPVAALRNGSILHVNGDVVTLEGVDEARVFVPGSKPKDYKVGADLSFLLEIAEEDCLNVLSGIISSIVK